MELPSNKEFALLAALGSSECSGKDLMDRYAEETGESMAPGTLYVTMSRLQAAGWITVTDQMCEDRRRRFFKMTPDGVAALTDAVKFYSRLINLAEAAMVADAASPIPPVLS